MAKATIHKEIQMIVADYDDIVIDGPPLVIELAGSVILAGFANRRHETLSTRLARHVFLTDGAIEKP